MHPTNFRNHKSALDFLQEPEGTKYGCESDNSSPDDFIFSVPTPLAVTTLYDDYPAVDDGVENNNTLSRIAKPSGGGEILISIRNLEHLHMIMESKLERKIDDMMKKLDSFALKSCRRKRTSENRCQALNRKGESCNGYICKEKSKHLCYAHFVLVNKKIEESGYLYKSK